MKNIKHSLRIALLSCALVFTPVSLKAKPINTVLGVTTVVCYWYAIKNFTQDSPTWSHTFTSFCKSGFLSTCGTASLIGCLVL